MTNSPATHEEDGEGAEKPAPYSEVETKLDGPPEDVQGFIIQAIESVRSEIFIGPLPSPEILRDYDDLLPGLADRIVVMAENQSSHRIEIERNHIRDSGRHSLLGLVSGTVLAFFALYIGLEFVKEGQSAFGFAAVLGTIVSLTGIYVLGRRAQAQELSRKAEETPKTLDRGAESPS